MRSGSFPLRTGIRWARARIRRRTARDDLARRWRWDVFLDLHLLSWGRWLADYLYAAVFTLSLLLLVRCCSFTAGLHTDWRWASSPSLCVLFPASLPRYIHSLVSVAFPLFPVGTPAISTTVFALRTGSTALIIVGDFSIETSISGAPLSARTGWAVPTIPLSVLSLSAGSSLPLPVAGDDFLELVALDFVFLFL